MTKAQKSPFPR